jgi:hypothetical protein
MRFLEVSEYGEQQFYRLTGVKREVFESNALRRDEATARMGAAL